MGLFRQLCLLAAFSFLATGCAVYPRIGRAAKPMANDAVVGEWKSPDTEARVRCQRVKSGVPEYRVSDGRFWARLWGKAEPDLDVRFYRIRHALWIEISSVPAGGQAASDPATDDAGIGMFRFTGPDQFEILPLDTNWLYGYAIRHPNVLPYAPPPRGALSLRVTASPERWYWFLQHKVRYPRDFGKPIAFERVK